MTGNWSGSASGGSASGTTCLAAALNGAGDCTCGSRTYTYKSSYAASNSDCNSRCPNGGTSKGNAVAGTGSGSSCSTAKSQAESNRIAEFNRNYTSYCNCNSARWSASIQLTTSASYDINCRIDYNNPCETSKSGRFRFTYYVDGSRQTHEFTKSIPPGNSWMAYTHNAGKAYTDASASCVTCSGSC